MHENKAATVCDRSAILHICVICFSGVFFFEGGLRSARLGNTVFLQKDKVRTMYTLTVFSALSIIISIHLKNANLFDLHVLKN